MRTALRWLAGLFVVYLILRGLWRLAGEVGRQDWVGVVSSVLVLMFLLWLFDTFRPGGPIDLRRHKPNLDTSDVT